MGPAQDEQLEAVAVETGKVRNREAQKQPPVPEWQ